MLIELAERELLVTRCALGIEIKNREIEKYHLELRLDKELRHPTSLIANINERLDAIDNTLPELYDLERKLQDYLDNAKAKKT